MTPFSSPSENTVTELPYDAEDLNTSCSAAGRSWMSFSAGESSIPYAFDRDAFRGDQSLFRDDQQPPYVSVAGRIMSSAGWGRLFCYIEDSQEESRST
jgi:hypothetical protein